MTYQYNKTPSISDLLIAMLCSGKSTRRFYQIIREREFARYKQQSVRVSLSRLQSNGYVKNSPNGWSITAKGRQRSRSRLLDYIPSPFEKDVKPAVILSFDIPETHRPIRNWIRNQIKIFGYTMLQQSLWLGPGPLPSTFLKRLKDLKIDKNVKTFNISKKSS